MSDFQDLLALFTEARRDIDSEPFEYEQVWTDMTAQVREATP